MPALSNKSHVEVLHAMMGEVSDFGQIDLAKRAGGKLRIAKARMRMTSKMGLATSIDVTLETEQFEEPPVFTIEFNQLGPRVYIHGISGELAMVVTVLEDGSVLAVNHQP